MYWENIGPDNTEATIEAALKRADELQIVHIVLASTSGATAERLYRQSKRRAGLQFACVTHHVGFTGPGEDEMSAAARADLGKKGFKLLTSTHLLAGVDRALRNKFQGVYPSEIAASVLRMFGQGMKVCVEIGVMALDAGLIPFGEEVIAIAGSGRGADTSCVLVPAHSSNFFDTKIKEIICMPRNK